MDRNDDLRRGGWIRGAELLIVGSVWTMIGIGAGKPLVAVLLGVPCLAGGLLAIGYDLQRARAPKPTSKAYRRYS